MERKYGLKVKNSLKWLKLIRELWNNETRRRKNPLKVGAGTGSVMISTVSSKFSVAKFWNDKGGIEKY
jgi:hypothetical protein